MLPFEEENGYPALCDGCWLVKHGNELIEFETHSALDREGFQRAAYPLECGGKHEKKFGGTEKLL